MSPSSPVIPQGGKRMRKVRNLVLIYLLVAPAVSAQTTQPAHSYMQEAVIEHQNGSATVVANSPRPLSQALTAIRREYGWVVDYEDPLYRDSDLTTWSDPRFPSRIFKVPAGGAFQSTYPEGPLMWSQTGDEDAVLEKIVADYNASGNPGQFVVLPQSDGSYAVVGSEPGSTAPPILSTAVSIPSGTRTLGDTLYLITEAVSAAAGVAVYANPHPGMLNLLVRTQVTVGATGVPARSLLVEAFTHANGKIAWDMRCNAPLLPGCMLNFMPVSRAQRSTFGAGPPVSVQ
jgi:hypothetical protein